MEHENNSKLLLPPKLEGNELGNGQHQYDDVLEYAQSAIDIAQSVDVDAAAA